ncbi:type VI secretion system baseplate subunit TssF [Shewanella sp. VB17]|uniref:type VI secretion system baseplate subunit TssF n=1 Tax=Shewanella sp. VB17 TaxID=2739432 RepID=UPI0015671100|nr:type VI secretion system baseplate subunit TssF [Shewanella sp. VB17]NRD73739.1 type VI secretion system baseplate subunit TssF [Shewanella sp. VB17]
MSQDKYFRDELAFLREQGKQFSDLHPQLARYLHGNNTDPDVERLLEGFAFLTGRLREKIDDEFPELTHSMINMLWPNYLRPVPSTSIVRFSPHARGISNKQLIEKGCMLDTNEVDGEVCHFTTCRDVNVYPLSVNNIESFHSREASIIDIYVSNFSDLSLHEIGLDDLRFYLGGQNHSAQMLYLWLNHYLEGIDICIGDKHYSLPNSSFKCVGFESGDGILPYPKNVYEGYRILQEYLSFSDAFMFFDICKIYQCLPSGVGGDFSIKLKFSRTLPADVLIQKEIFQLYCVPVLNLFSHDADPIDLTGKKSEYPIFPSSRKPANFEIFSVDKVQGWHDSDSGRVRGEERVYTPFESFQHEVERVRERVALYYRLRARESIRGDGFDHFLSFVRGDETQRFDANEAVSVSLTCTNRQLPTQLGKGDICVTTDSSPTFASFENITEPSASLRPVLDGSMLWTLISNLSLNYLSLLSKDALCSIIRAYDFKSLIDRQAERVTQKRLDGIVSIDSKPTERIFRGMPVRGLQSVISLDQHKFGSEGDLYLFATVLSRFFALYASINSFHELIVINTVNQERYTWDIQIGQQPLI